MHSLPRNCNIIGQVYRSIPNKENKEKNLRKQVRKKEIKIYCLCKCIAWKYHKLYDSHMTLAMAVTAFYGKEIMLSYGL